MVTGPSIGPAMVLTVLMRWPVLIVVCALGGAGVALHDQVDLDQVKDSVYSLGDDLNIKLRGGRPEIAPGDQARTAVGKIQTETMVQVTVPAEAVQKVESKEEIEKELARLKALQHVEIRSMAVKMVTAETPLTSSN